MKFMFLIQARLGSTRLPGKVLKPIYKDITLLELIYQRTLFSKYADRSNVYVLTSDNPQDDLLVDFLESKNILYSRGDENDVYQRYYSFLSKQNPLPEFFFRICSDNPFLEPSFIDNMCKVAIDQYPNVDYVSYVSKDGVAIIQKKYGLFCELINTETFLKLDPQSQYARENVTPLLYQSGEFKIGYLPVPTQIEESDFSLCVDTFQDLANCKKILTDIGKDDFSYTDLLLAL